MNRCKPEKVGAKEYGKILKRIQVLEDDRIPAKEARKEKIEGQKRRITRKEHRILWNEFETGRFVTEDRPCNVAKRKCLKIEVLFPRKMEIN